ncbi:MAG: Na+/H+ antiporter subunit G [Candidatus Competibacterales bacterium]|nr:Na+/H+ antiporter subunit G [Candidatus Competibacterales bacterium]
MLSDLATALFLLVGSGFALVGAIGLIRLPGFFARLHAPTKATTLGIGGILVGSSIHFSGIDGLSLHELLILAFLFITAPISGHLLCKAGLHLSLGADQEGAPEGDTEPH